MTQLRSDAQRNLGRVLDAAAEVFAERGPEASADESQAERVKTRYKETDHVKNYYRVNRY